MNLIFLLSILTIYGSSAATLSLSLPLNGTNSTIATSPGGKVWPSPDKYRTVTMKKIEGIAEDYRDMNMDVFNVFDRYTEDYQLYEQNINFHTSLWDKYGGKFAVIAVSYILGEKKGWEETKEYEKRWKTDPPNEKTFRFNDDIKFVSLNAFAEARIAGCGGAIMSIALNYGDFMYEKNVLRNVFSYFEYDKSKYGKYQANGLFVHADTGEVVVSTRYGPFFRCDGTKIPPPTTS